MHAALVLVHPRRYIWAVNVVWQYAHHHYFLSKRIVSLRIKLFLYISSLTLGRRAHTDSSSLCTTATHSLIFWDFIVIPCPDAASEYSIPFISPSYLDMIWKWHFWNLMQKLYELLKKTCLHTEQTLGRFLVQWFLLKLFFVNAKTVTISWMGPILQKQSHWISVCRSQSI